MYEQHEVTEPMRYLVRRDGECGHQPEWPVLEECGRDEDPVQNVVNTVPDEDQHAGGLIAMRMPVIVCVGVAALCAVISSMTLIMWIGVVLWIRVVVRVPVIVHMLVLTRIAAVVPNVRPSCVRERVSSLSGIRVGVALVCVRVGVAFVCVRVRMTPARFRVLMALRKLPGFGGRGDLGPRARGPVM
jgi:hypothetical protein